MSNIFTKPMLAVEVKDINELTYPCFASPKLDGIRALMKDGHLVSRSFKPIPNHHIRNILEKILPDGIDGEILVGNNFQDCSSGVMSHDKTPTFTYNAFDYATDVSMPFGERYANLLSLYLNLKNYRDFSSVVNIVPHHWITNPAELQAFEEKCFLDGFEGVMTRLPSGPYKNGRSTAKEQFLLKIKRWLDDEGVITGFEEQMRNENEAEENELGHTSRSTAAANMIPANTLGAFVIASQGFDELKVGSGLGLTKELRQEIWDNKDKYMGKILTYKYQPFGVKDKPRFPIFKGFRHPDDISK